MEAKKSRKAAIENQRSSWLLMGVVVALAFMFVSFEWTRQDVKLAAYSSAHDPIFEEVLIPITHPEEVRTASLSGYQSDGRVQYSCQ
ncbi:hypothetical protein HMPREF1981_00759 [Bacteroides pyogenes F0041]|uniref:Uncharacterized protein n=1 Tax=Bacteroides pyogenes F0041 TaxID=1321819 RepID=U2CQQ3_9BACE|nr:hypothetical protein [Bacteroides pyogenes]ERI86860.1 hypothetical protein HMPREF1981_00759 [Bacteroides pyogenes F0041]MBB3895826.1 protein TonB [Bacteroides pyogenes]GAE22341.1 hypothetical protein JCM10003_1923 [Bacteroides pyogenes JCM 10003]SUV31584.1 TonB [Bacteroides pyogenes]